MRIMDALGRIAGGVLSPLTALGSLARNARLFHPDGAVYWAHVRPLATDGPRGDLARRLEGPALVRISGAWWRRGKEWPDLLGIAIRFTTMEGDDVSDTSTPSKGDQDLLFATVRTIGMLPIAPFLTNVHDFFANDYYALLPFSVPELGRVKFRLLPLRLRSDPGSRRDKLEVRVEAGSAVLRLEVKKDEYGAKWQEVSAVHVEQRAVVDEESLAFNPFRTGRDIVPVGAIQMVRAATYRASVWGRRAARGGG